MLHLFTSQRFLPMFIPFLSLLLGAALAGQEVAESTADQDQVMQQRLERFRQVEDVMGIIEGEYLTTIDRQRLWSGAYNGMSQILDSHSYYTDQRSAVMYVPGIDQESRGFGFDWRHDHLAGGLMVRRVIPNSSAHQAGMVPGDLLVQIDDLPLLGTPPTVSAERLATSSDRIVLHVRQADGSTQALQLERKPLNDNSIVRAEIIDAKRGIGLIHISRFLGNQSDRPEENAQSLAQTITGVAFRTALERLNGEGMSGLILDLRGNGGGSIPAAVEVADCFLSGSDARPRAITRQRGRNISRHKDWFANGSNTLSQDPLVVLIDGSTASAAEVLSAALQDHHRAVIVGTPSVGKDTIQQTYYLENGGALRLTVARFLTPKGRSINGVGVIPDIAAPMTAMERFAIYRRAWFQRQGTTAPEAYRQAVDNQLERAIEALTALLVIKGNTP